LILTGITSENFRNLASEYVDFHPSVNIVVGRNGQGKTNLLEAIYFLAMTKSFRTSRVASMFRFDSPTVRVAGALERDGIARMLSAGFERSAPHPADDHPLPAGRGEGLGVRGRVLMINGEKVPLTTYVSAMSVFAYSQSRLEIIRGTPEERRRFLDRGIASINPGYLEQLMHYTRVLKQRNALLHSDATSSSLEAWNDEFIAAAAVVHRAREAYVREIAAELPMITMIYRGSGDEPELRENLAKLRRDEIRARMSLAGPQRDTLEFLVGDPGRGRPAQDVLSGGEQKMIVLQLKFAKVALFRRRFDEPPLFLLDDIDAELDLDVLQKLLGRLPARTQVFATSAKEAFLQALEAGPHRRLTIEKGTVTASRDFA
jgi:DNA replication and repair protein RecF